MSYSPTTAKIVLDMSATEQPYKDIEYLGPYARMVAKPDYVTRIYFIRGVPERVDTGIAVELLKSPGTCKEVGI